MSILSWLAFSENSVVTRHCAVPQNSHRYLKKLFFEQIVRKIDSQSETSQTEPIFLDEWIIGSHFWKN